MRETSSVINSNLPDLHSLAKSAKGFSHDLFIGALARPSDAASVSSRLHSAEFTPLHRTDPRELIRDGNPYNRIAASATLVELSQPHSNSSIETVNNGRKQEAKEARTYARQLSALYGEARSRAALQVDRDIDPMPGAKKRRKERMDGLSKDATQALFALFELSKLPENERNEQMEKFRRTWYDRSDEYEAIFRSIAAELEKAAKEPEKSNKNYKLVEAMKLGYEAGRKKIDPDYELHKQERKEKERWKDIASDIAAILKNRDLPLKERLELLEKMGYSKDAAIRKLSGITTAGVVTGASIAIATPAGVAAALYGASHPFVEGFPDPKGIAVAVAFRVGYYLVLFLKAKANLRMNKNSGIGISVTGTAFFHTLDGIVPDKIRDWVSMAGTVSLDAVEEAPYMLAGFAPEVGTSASIAADTYGMAHTGSVAGLGLAADALLAGIAKRKLERKQEEVTMQEIQGYKSREPVVSTQ